MLMHRVMITIEKQLLILKLTHNKGNSDPLKANVQGKNR